MILSQLQHSYYSIRSSDIYNCEVITHRTRFTFADILPYTHHTCHYHSENQRNPNKQKRNRIPFRTRFRITFHENIIIYSATVLFLFNSHMISSTPAIKATAIARHTNTFCNHAAIRKDTKDIAATTNAYGICVDTWLM